MRPRRRGHNVVVRLAAEFVGRGRLADRFLQGVLWTERGGPRQGQRVEVLRHIDNLATVPDLIR
jgi:hypothetical protein